jgi:prevent-host-death family protein
MKTASLSEVKNDLSRYVDHVRRGATVRILVRGLPVADLVPVVSGEVSSEELEDLERRGVIRQGKGGFPSELEKPGPKVKRGSAVDLLLEDRRRGR